MSLTPRVDAIEKNAVRNVIINGNFDLWQRGTSKTLTSNDQFYLADRFHARCVNGVSANTSITRDSDTPDVLSSFSLKYEVTATEASFPANAYYDCRYAVEGYDFQRFHGKKMLLSFYVKSTKTGLYHVNFVNSGQDRRYTTTYTIDSASTWEKKVIVIDAPDLNIGSWNLNNGTGSEIVWTLGVGSTYVGSPTLNTWENDSFRVGPGQVNLADTMNATWQLSQIMLTAVDDDFDETIDVPFQRAGKTFAEELAMAQRYYEKSYNLDVAPATLTTQGEHDWKTTAGNWFGTVELTTRKRAIPTVTYYSPISGVPGTGHDNSGGTKAMTTFVGGTTQFGAQMATSAGSQVSFHYTADAEL